MREIKFSGKGRYNNEWIKGFLVCRETKTANGNYAIDVEIYSGECQWEVDPDSVGQYTGVKDETGTEIYEGDIVRVDCYNKDYLGVVRFGRNKTIGRNEIGYYIDWPEYTYIRDDLGYWQSEDNILVVGNEYDRGV